ncbi:LppP/LprE family lipoprotein [Protofrankia symbiont of Coriaria ruscifolia]|nr:LppP/LprE family lipoprotein [Protofrankia symbiont of Coriaria ruscifolia]
MTFRRCLVVILMIVTVTLTGWGGGTVLAAPAPQSGTSAPSPDRAEALVRARGYTATETGGYDPDNDLSVIVGRWTDAVDGHPQQAFLFHRGRLVGTDTLVPSATIGWLWSTSDVVALTYQLYRTDDPLCCPTAGAATVRYQWNGTKIVPLDSVPAADWSASASRRAVRLSE